MSVDYAVITVQRTREKYPDIFRAVVMGHMTHTEYNNYQDALKALGM